MLHDRELRFHQKFIASAWLPPPFSMVYGNPRCESRVIHTNFCAPVIDTAGEKSMFGDTESTGCRELLSVNLSSFRCMRYDMVLAWPVKLPTPTIIRAGFLAEASTP